MSTMRIADFLRHDVQAYGVPGAPDIDRILQACIEAANWIDKLESRLAQVELERDAAVYDMVQIVHEVDDIACKWCKNAYFDEVKCKECRFHNESFEWQGVQPTNTKDDAHDP